MNDYERIRAILDAATPGPWETFGGYDAFRTIATTADHTSQWSVALPADDSVPGFMRDPEADARAIVVARNLAPELLAVAEAAAVVCGDEPWVDAEEERTAWLTLRAALDALYAEMKETLT